MKPSQGQVLSEDPGRLFQINRSRGGVPKTGIHTVALDFLGMEGDGHAHPGVHGGPDRAVCLYSLERILALQAEGHPVFPGALGENFTLSGLAWDKLTPGFRLRIGEQVFLEIASYTTPCSSIRPFFKEGNIARISQKYHPGWSRHYARVLQPGMVKVGDLVKLVEKGA
jgi:MOSC domain-containing protein YiiM